MCEVFLCFIEHLNIQKLSDITKAIPMFFKGIAYFLGHYHKRFSGKMDKK